MAKALILYSSRTNQTKDMANVIAEGMRFEGIDATVLNVNDYDKNKVNVAEYDAVLIGSPTYHGDMVQSIKTLLFALESANLEGKVGGAFGAFGWSGEAPPRIFDTMKNIYKMEMVSGPLMLKSTGLGGGIKMAQDYGREVARKIAEKR